MANPKSALSAWRTKYGKDDEDEKKSSGTTPTKNQTVKTNKGADEVSSSPSKEKRDPKAALSTWQQRYGGAKYLPEDKVSGVASLVDEINSFTQRVGNEYSSREGKFQSSVPFTRYANDTQAEINRIKSQADAYRQHFTENRNAYDSKMVDNILAVLDDSSTWLNDAHSSLGGERDYWSQWENEDAYNEYNRLMDLDLGAAKKQLETLTAQMEQAKKAKDKAYTAVSGAQRYGGMDLIEKHSQQQVDAQATYDELSQQVAALNRDIYNAQHYQDSAMYNAYMDAPDFGSFTGTENPNEYMTDDERSIYNYLLAKDGQEAAGEYLEHLQEAINYRKGTETGENIRGIESDVGRFLATGAHGVWSGLNQFGRGIGQLFTDEMLATSPTEYASSYIMKDLAENGTQIPGMDKTWGEMGYEGASVLANMAPSVLVTAVTGGLGAPAGIASAAGAATLGLSATGNAYNQALGEGYTKDQAKTYAIAVGASEGALQYLLGGIGKLAAPSGVSGKLLSKVASIDNGLLRAAAAAGIKSGSEIVEEELQNYLEPLYRTLIFGEEYDAPTVEDIVYTAVLTFLTTGVMEAGDVSTYLSNKPAEYGKQFKGMGDDVVQAIIDEGLVSAPETESHQLAEALGAKVKAGQTVNDWAVGRLYQANAAAIKAEAQKASQEAAGARVSEDPAASEKTPAKNEYAPRSPKNAVYGDAGMATFRSVVETSDMSAEEVQKAFQSPYEMGYNNKLGHAAEKLTGIQKEAYNAGRLDAMNDLAERKRKNPTIWEDAGFDMTGAPADISSEDRAFMQLMAKAYAVKGVWGESTESETFDGKISSNAIVTMAKDFGISTEKLQEIGGVANLNKIAKLANERNKSMTFLLSHEIAVHRMMELAPDEGMAFMNALYQAKNAGRPAEAGTLAEGMQARYEAGNRRITTSLAMEEITADSIIEMYGDEKKFREAMERIITGKDEKAKSGAKKFIEILKDTVAKLKRMLDRLRGKENAEARKDVQDAIRENEQLIKLFEDAQKAALKKVESGSEQEYTGSNETKHSLKEAFKNGRERAEEARRDTFKADRVLHWEETSEGRRKAPEHRSRFLKRMEQCGATRREDGDGTVYAYLRVANSRAGVYAQQAAQELRKLGIKDFFIYDGEIQWNENRTTHGSNNYAATLGDGGIGINNSTEMTDDVAPPKELAAHETIHRKFNAGDVAALQYRKTVVANSKVTHPMFLRYFDLINFGYHNYKLDFNNVQDRAEFFREFIAFVGGFIYAGNVDVSSMFEDYDAVHSALEKALGVKIENKYGEKFSMKDSTGAELTKEQQEYFKDSKVVDKDGNIKVVYHGSPAKFTKFSYEFIGSTGSAEGRGFYFTDKKSMAEGYQRDGGQIMEGYLNIAKPLSLTKKTMKRTELAKLLKAIDPTGDDIASGYDMSGGMGYPSKAWYTRAMNDAVKMIWDGNDNDADILAEIANASGGNETVLKTAKELLGYDGYIAEEKYNGASVYVAFSSEQFKNKDNLKPTSDPDVRYSTKDSEGKTLTAEQQEFFKDSVIRDKNGSLMPMYHGTLHGGFTVFGRKDYWYFTNDKKYAYAFEGKKANGQLYPHIKEGVESGAYTPARYKVYLNVTNPFVTDDIDVIEDALYWDRSLASKLRDKGYDALMLEDMSQVIVLNANQIKNTTNKKPTSDPDIRFSMKDQEQLLEENAKLKEVNQELQEQFKTTKFAQVDKKSLDAFAKKLLKDYQSGADIDETRDALNELYTYIANGENGDGPVWQEAYKRAYDTAVEILEQSSDIDDYMYQQYKELRNEMRTRGLYLDKEYTRDLVGYESINEFRQAHFGSIKMTNDGIPVDVAYADLADRYPEFFNANEYNNPADQLMHIAEVLDSLKPVEVNRYAYNMRESATWLANDIMERFFELPQAKPTFADKAQQKLTKQVIHDAKKLEKLREQKNERIAQVIKREKDRTADVRKTEREKRSKAVKQVKEYYLGKQAAGSERRNSAVLRKRIAQHASDLSKKLLKPTDNQHVPESLRTTVAAVLEAINLESQYTIDPVTGKRTKGGGGDPVKRTEAFRKLKEAYSKILQQEGGDMVIDPSLLGNSEEGFDGYFDIVLGMSDTKLADMSLAQLEIMWRVIRAVESSITKAGKLLASQKFERTSEWAEAFEEDTDTRRRLKGSKIEKFRLDLENPYTFFEHYGKAGNAVFRMLRDAQDAQQDMVEEVNEAVRKIVDPKQVKAWEKEVHEFKTERGEKLVLTAAHMMEIHELMKREQARDHLMKGGIVQPEIKSKKIYRGTDSVLLSLEDIMKILKPLTKEQMAVADKLQGLTTGLLAKYGNAASMRAYGYEKFTGSDYWPIKSAREGIHSNIEKGGSNTRSIKNIGLAKSVIPHASNPLDIGGIFSTFASHAADMTDYAAWLCPMEDANRLYNFKFRDENGQQSGMTMKGLLDRYGGSGAQKYWHNLMEDIQNGISLPNDTAIMNVINKSIGNARAASVGANIRVIVQQPTAIIRAATVLSPADMAKGLAAGATKGNGWKKALKHSDIAKRKDMGGFDISSPAQMNEILFDSQTGLQKFNDAMMWGAGKADAVTWGKIWNACEWSVKGEGKLETGSEEFYERVADLFAEVVDQSQVVDGVLQRSQMMRSSNALVKQATAFMGEPTMALNMMLRAYDNLVNEKDSKKRGKAIKAFGRTALVLLITNVVNAAAQSLVDAFRDDEDEEYWEKFKAAFTGITGDEESPWEKAWNAVMSGNLGSNANLIGNIPFAKDLLSILQGYDVTRADADILADIVNASHTFFDSVTGEGKKTIANATWNLAKQVGKVFGISAPNVTRDIYGMLRTIALETGNIPAQYEMEKWIYKASNSKNGSRFMDILYRAYNEDKVAFDKIYAEMVAEDYYHSVNDEGKVTTTAEYIASELKSDLIDDLFELYKNDQAAYKEMYNDLVNRDLLATGVKTDDPETDTFVSTVEAIAKAMEDRMKEDQGVKSVSDLEQRFLTPEQQPKWDSAMADISSSGLWRSADEEERDALEEKLHGIITESKGTEEIREKIADGASYGLDETEYLLYTLALDMYDQPSEKGEYGSYNTQERADAILNLNADDNEMAYLWSLGTTSDEVFEALDYGVAIDKYIEFKDRLSQLEAGVDYKKGDTKSRKRAVTNLLNELGLSSSDYWWLYHTEYKK